MITIYALQFCLGKYFYEGMIDKNLVYYFCGHNIE